MDIYLLVISEKVCKEGSPGLSRMRRFVKSSAIYRPGMLHAYISAISMPFFTFIFHKCTKHRFIHLL